MKGFPITRTKSNYGNHFSLSQVWTPTACPSRVWRINSSPIQVWTHSVPMHGLEYQPMLQIGLDTYSIPQQGMKDQHRPQLGLSGCKHMFQLGLSKIKHDPIGFDTESPRVSSLNSKLPPLPPRGWNRGQVGGNI